MTENKRYRDAVVVVTGGGQGIGRCIAFTYAQEGAKIVIAEKDVEAGYEVEEHIRSVQKGAAMFVYTDVADERSVQQMANKVKETYNKIDILVNNAGICEFGSIWQPNSLELFDKVIAVNLRGAYAVTKCCLPLMLNSDLANRNKNIVNISSTRALMSEPNSEAYAASKVRACSDPWELRRNNRPRNCLMCLKSFDGDFFTSGRIIISDSCARHFSECS
jgi:NAD(P)-dependent dehydrogenase (short-subunit alcohol dehydrogenase family)